MKTIVAFLLVAIAGAAHAGTQPPPTIPAVRPDPKALTDFSRSLVRVNSTVQPFDFLRPWTKKNPSARRGTGVVVGPNRVLVTAALIANYSFVEFERPSGGARTPAKVVAVDYEANLALLEGADAEFLKDAVPVHLDETARLGSSAEILQLEPNGDIAPTAARITTITIAPYAIDDIGFLIFRLSAQIQQRDGSFVLPVVREGRLLGLVMRYDNRNQTADVIPPVVISRFLENADRAESEAFPRAGIGVTSLRDPQLRKYYKVQENGGVLITRVDSRSPAAEAGVKTNDVLLAIDGRAIDSDGNFAHPEYGRIPLSYLVTTARKSGETAVFSVLRDGEKMEIPVKLFRRNPDDASVPPYVIDQQPYFLISGGFVFQELSRTLLQEWGPDWRSSAPQRLVYAEMFQNELRPSGDKVVILNGVLPSPATMGYENLSGLIVEAVNGKPIRSLDDLAAALADTTKIHRIQVDSDPRIIFLDGATAASDARSLARQYGIPQLQNLPNRKQKNDSVPAPEEQKSDAAAQNQSDSFNEKNSPAPSEAPTEGGVERQPSATESGPPSDLPTPSEISETQQQ